MSRSLYIKILLPLDQYNSTDVYEDDERLQRIYGNEFKEGKYCKKLKIRSVYASTEDIIEFLKKTYGVTNEDIRDCSISHDGRRYCYHFKNREDVWLWEEVYNSLKKEHVDEALYCLEYKSFSPEIYGSVQGDLFTDDHMIIDDQLIDKAIELLEKECLDDEDEESEIGREENKDARDVVIDKIIDYEVDMDGRLIASLILARDIAKRVGGIAVAEYD